MKTPKYKRILCLELLKTFSEKEMEDLSYFVNCRYFNTDKYIVELFNALKKYDLNNKVLNNEFQCTIYEKIFLHLPKPNDKLTKNQSSQLNRKMNDLMRLAERFLSIEALEKNETCKDELLYPVLLNRRQFLLFNRHINQELKILDKQTIRDWTYYARRFQMELNYLDYLNYNNKLREEDNLSEVIYNLEMYYLLNKLSLHLTAWSIKNITNKEYDFLINPYQSLPDLTKFDDTPMVALYSANIELTKTKDVEAYQNLLDLLGIHSEVLPPFELKNFYTTIIGYCISKINAGELEYERNMFEIYQIMHQKNLLIEDNFISIGELKNVVASSCRVAEFEWAAKMIETYKKYIKVSIRESVYHFNYGAIAFYKKNYEVAHDRFIRVGKVNMIYDINVKVLILKCLYENEKEYSEPTIQAFRTAERYFTKHQSLTQQRKKAYKNFIQILINLYRVRHHEGKRTLEWLKEKLEEQKVNSDKRWLMEKITALEKK